MTLLHVTANVNDIREECRVLTERAELYSGVVVGDDVGVSVLGFVVVLRRGVPGQLLTRVDRLPGGGQSLTTVNQLTRVDRLVLG